MALAWMSKQLITNYILRILNIWAVKPSYWTYLFFFCWADSNEPIIYIHFVVVHWGFRNKKKKKKRKIFGEEETQWALLNYATWKKNHLGLQFLSVTNLDLVPLNFLGG